MTISPPKVASAQLRAGRALLDWSQHDLAEAAGLSRPSIDRAERTEVGVDTLAAICRALEKAGVIFVDENGEGPGVRLRKSRRRY